MVDGPIVEGSTILCPPVASGSQSGPGTRDRDVPFYNPGMALNRDLSVRLVRAECVRKGRELDVADVLAGAGARSLRVAREVDAPLIVHANDGDPNAIAAMEEARGQNEIPRNRLKIRHGNAHGFLASRRFDIIDVDPFGSPMPFLDAALASVRHDGLVCITATDTGALSGTYTKACRRRYGAEPLHKPEWRTEVGLRILMGCVVRSAGRFDRAAAPVLAVARGHWMRVVMRISDGRARADAAGARLGFVTMDEQTGGAAWSDAGAGPLWTGPLHDPEMVQAMADQDAASAHKDTEGLLPVLVAEASAAPFWHHVPTLHSKLGGASMPRRAHLLRAMAEAGLDAAPCHMDVQGIRSNASPEEMMTVWKQATTSS